MTRGKVTLDPWQKQALYGTLAVLWVTGAVWLVAHFSQTDASVVSPTQPWAMKVHGAVAMLYLVTLGTLLPIHVRLAWHQERNRVAGAALLAVNGFLLMTGWMLYYIGSETARPVISILHWGTGLGLPLFIYLHIRFARHYPAKK